MLYSRLSFLCSALLMSTSCFAKMNVIGSLISQRNDNLHLRKYEDGSKKMRKYRFK